MKKSKVNQKYRADCLALDVTKLEIAVARTLKDRDNWKAKALAYREIIKRARAEVRIGSHYAILNEADKLDKEGK